MLQDGQQEKKYWNGKYFDGKITVTNSLAWCACHEFSHFIQRMNGWRYDGSVHNDDFYRVCDRLHRSGLAHQVRDFIVNQVGPIEFIDPSDTLAAERANRLSAGQWIQFPISGQVVAGVITRVNKKTYSVDGQAGRYKVPFAIAVRIEV